MDLDKLTYAGNLDSLASVAESENHVFVQGDFGDQRLVRRPSLPRLAVLRSFSPRKAPHPHA